MKFSSSLMGLMMIATLLPALGCRGESSASEPIVPIRNMHQQPRYGVQQRSDFFEDGRTMRPLVDGAVAREMERDPVLQSGKMPDNSYVAVIPDAVVQRHGSMEDLLNRGQDRYNIYCAPCHGLSGDGNGAVAQRAEALNAANLSPPTFHENRLRHIPDGQMFATIANGIRNMPPYSQVVNVDDRWAIVGYVRALQLSQATPQERAQGVAADVPIFYRPAIELSAEETACQAAFSQTLAENRIEFATASSTVRSGSQALLASLVQAAAACPEALVEVGGHTDAVGDAAFNQTLSAQRANSVRDALVGLGLPTENVNPVGYGQTRPRADNATEEGRAENRRIEFYIVRSFDTAEGATQ